MELCTLLHVRRYNFRDNEGRTVEGVNLTYLTGDVETMGDRRACAPLTVSAPVEIFGQLGAVPGVYGFDFKQRPGKNVRPTLQVVGLQFRAALDGHLQPVPTQ